MAVLIIGNRRSMSSEIEVMDWVSFKATRAKLHSLNDLISEIDLEITIDDGNEKPFGLKENVDSIWFRRDEGLSFNIQSELDDGINRNVNYDQKILNKALSKLLKEKYKLLSNYESFSLNKILVLETAFNVGLDVPVTLVTNNKNDVESFLAKHGRVICKSIGENLTVFFDNNSKALKQYVVEVDKQKLEGLPERFFPTLFQECLHKQMDVRIFYLNGSFFPMAIFSGSLDFREDYHNHRNVPVQLPKELEKKLHQLMQNLNLNTGSIDMVRCAKTKKFYFLEINPNGQFGMVSKPCNYYLEREIADFLVNK